MARAKSHGAAAARHHTNQHTPGNDEEVGLLAAGSNRDLYDDDDNDGSGNGSVMTSTRGPPRSLAIPSPPSAESLRQQHLQQQLQQEQDHSGILSPRTPRTPRTPNRVRFDLRPTIVDQNGHARQPSEPLAEHHHHARESFDIDDEDPLNPGSAPALGRGAGRGHQRVPLLTDIEAPSVTLANTSWPDGIGGGSEEEVHAWAEAERSRPKSGLRMAFMNMANSIIGAGIIGQPYALRQAGLLAGVVLLVVLTFLVDWTICLIVVNSKLSGANSFQGTVEKCFGRPGLIAISVAQWVFAFGGMVAFGVIVGDSIPHVLEAVWPGLREMPVMGLLADRRVVIALFTLCISYPLALYRDIAKVSLMISPSPLF